MRIARIYSIAGEHVITIDGMAGDFRASEDEGAYGDDPQENALHVVARLEVIIRDRRVTHCIDLVDPEDAPQEPPVPIALFLERWRAHIRDVYPTADDVAAQRGGNGTPSPSSS
jgi:hypothetical protein